MWGFGRKHSTNGGAMSLKLGSRVRDIYTGFEGVLVARTAWLHGCDRLTIEPTRLKEDGSLADAMTFDEARVELVQEEPVRVSKDSADRRNGGPNGPAPARSRDPRR